MSVQADWSSRVESFCVLCFCVLCCVCVDAVAVVVAVWLCVCVRRRARRRARQQRGAVIGRTDGREHTQRHGASEIKTKPLEPNALCALGPLARSCARFPIQTRSHRAHTHSHAGSKRSQHTQKAVVTTKAICNTIQSRGHARAHPLSRSPSVLPTRAPPLSNAMHLTFEVLSLLYKRTIETVECTSQTRF